MKGPASLPARQDQPQDLPTTYNIQGNTAHIQDSRKAATESMVLLKNANDGRRTDLRRSRPRSKR